MQYSRDMCVYSGVDLKQDEGRQPDFSCAKPSGLDKSQKTPDMVS